MKPLRIALILALIIGSSACSGSRRTAPADSSTVYLAVGTDLHYIDPTLSSGPLFMETLSVSDGKLSQYSDEITDAFIEDCIRSHPAAVILSGDLTFNGEKRSHISLARKLQKLSDAGIQPLVIPGNHDIENPRAYNYSGDRLRYAATVTADDFRSIYAGCGYQNALSTDPSSLSYVYALNDQYWILMLDTCRYEDNNSFAAEASGRIREEQYSWIEQVLKEAQAKHISVLSVTHHNVIQMATGDIYTIADAARLQQLYAAYHVQVNLSGHTHAQYNASKATDGVMLTDIMTSSMAVYSHQYGWIAWTPDQLEYQTHCVDVQGWADRHMVSDSFLEDFSRNDRNWFLQNSVSRLSDVFANCGLDEETQQQLLTLKGEENICTFTGRMSQFAGILADSGLQETLLQLPEEERDVILNGMDEYTHDADHIQIALN